MKVNDADIPTLIRMVRLRAMGLLDDAEVVPHRDVVGELLEERAQALHRDAGLCHESHPSEHPSASDDELAAGEPREDLRRHRSARRSRNSS